VGGIRQQGVGGDINRGVDVFASEGEGVLHSDFHVGTFKRFNVSACERANVS
jgi:hypothetical protein